MAIQFGMPDRFSCIGLNNQTFRNFENCREDLRDWSGLTEDLPIPN